MSFLDNIKKKNEGGDIAPTSPFVKPNPLTAKNPLAKKTETKVESNAKKPLPLLAKKTLDVSTTAKPNPFGPKKTIAKVEEAKEQEIAVKEQEKTNLVTDMKAEEAPAKKVEEKKAVEPKSAAKKADSKPAAKAKKKNAKAKAEPVEKVDGFVMDIPTTSISYAEAIESVTSPFVDPDWEIYKENVQNDLNEIVIEDDMNPATLKSAVSKLTRIRNRVWNDFQSTKSQYELLASKEPEGLIERVKRTNLGDATNDMQRKKAGVEACMNYTDKSGNIINLYELLDETRARYNFLKAVMDSVEYKRSVLVTMNGALKIESNLGPAE